MFDPIGDLCSAWVHPKPDHDHLAEALSLFACLAFATVIIVVAWWKAGLAWYLG